MTTATDSFNRADGAVGSNWTTPSGHASLKIVSNQVVGTTSGGEGGIWNANSFGNDHRSKAFNVVGFEASSDRALIDFRLRDDGAGNYYSARVDRFGASSTFTLQFYKWVSDSPTSLGTDTSLTIEDGHDWEGRITDDLLEILQDDVVVYSINDSTYASGAANPLGFEIYTFVSDLLSIDSWEGGDVSAGSAATKVVFTTQPSNTVVGATMADVVVQALDGSDVLDTSFTGNVVIALQTGSGTLAGTLTVAAVAGVATFDDLSINTLNTGAVLRATSTGLTLDDSSTFNITAGGGAGGRPLIGTGLIS